MTKSLVPSDARSLGSVARRSPGADVPVGRSLAAADFGNSQRSLADLPRSFTGTPLRVDGAFSARPSGTPGTQVTLRRPSRSDLVVRRVGAGPATRTQGDRPSLAPLLSAVTDRTGVLRTPRGAFQVRVGWELYRDYLRLYEARLPLALRPDGRFKRVGDWSLYWRASLEVQDLRQNVRPARFPDRPAVPGGPAPASTGGRGVDGEFVLAHLPRESRAELTRLVPSPAWQEGTVLRFQEGRSLSYRLSLLRTDGNRAISVAASHDGGSTPWQSTHHHLLLGRTYAEWSAH